MASCNLFFFFFLRSTCIIKQLVSKKIFGTVIKEHIIDRVANKLSDANSFKYE